MPLSERRNRQKYIGERGKKRKKEREMKGEREGKTERGGMEEEGERKRKRKIGSKKRQFY